MMSLITKVVKFLVPPMEQRTRHTVLTTTCVLLTFLSSYAFALHVRLQKRKVPYVLRILILIIVSSFLSHLLFGHYAFFFGQPTANGQYLHSMWTGLDTLCGCAALCAPIALADAFFLGKEQDFDVQGADVYRKWLADQHPKLSTQEINGLEKLLSGGYTLERPRYYPGTWIPLELDLVFSRTRRGLGIKPVQYPSLAVKHDFQPGYDALILAEKLAKEPKQQRAKKMMADALKRAFFTFLGYVTVFEIAGAFVQYNGPLFKHWLGADKQTFYQPFLNSTLDRTLSVFLAECIATIACGVIIITSVQLTYLVLYISALLTTFPVTNIPVTISRYEPYALYKPYRATSMSDMWGLHWHPLLRRFFMVLCFRPALRVCKACRLPFIVGRVVGLMCSFTLSGIIHELALEVFFTRMLHEKLIVDATYDEKTLRKDGYGFGANSYASIKTFVGFGLSILAEQAWQATEPIIARSVKRSSDDKIITGKLRSLLAWTWTMSCMIFIGMPMMSAWCKHGLTSVAYFPNVF